ERLGGPAEIFARGGDLVGAERVAVDRGGALLVRRALADHRLAGDQRRARVGLGFGQRAADAVEIVPVAFDGVPAGGAVTGGNVLAGGKVGVAVDGDVVVVPQHVEIAQAEVPGEADRLVVDPFHQAAVAGQHP